MQKPPWMAWNTINILCTHAASDFTLGLYSIIITNSPFRISAHRTGKSWNSHYHIVATCPQSLDCWQFQFSVAVSITFQAQLTLRIPFMVHKKFIPKLIEQQLLNYLPLKKWTKLTDLYGTFQTFFYCSLYRNPSRKYFNIKTYVGNSFNCQFPL